MIDGVDDLTEVVRRDVGRHADGDALRSVHQQVGETAGENHRFLELTGVVVGEVDGVLVDVGEHVECHRSETTFGVARRGRRFVEGTEVALRVDEWVTKTERLTHAHERVVDRAVAMGVVLAHDLTGDTGALHGGSIGERTQVVHAPEDATMHGLEAVARVGERTRHDDRHRVVEERALHLVLDLDEFDRTGRCALFGLLVVGLRRLLAHVSSVRRPQMSRNRTSLALVWMNCLRDSTSSPMRIEKISSAIAVCSTETFSRVRRDASMVVSPSSS